MEGQYFVRHTVSPKLAQVAAILERLVEHQQGERLSTSLVLQKPVRLPLEHRSHHEQELRVVCWCLLVGAGSEREEECDGPLE